MIETKELIWWEKTVEYCFVANYLKGMIAPLDGNPEKSYGDAFLKNNGRFSLIEFKRDKSTLKSEEDKFTNYKKGKNMNYMRTIFFTLILLPAIAGANSNYAKLTIYMGNFKKIDTSNTKESEIIAMVKKCGAINQEISEVLLIENGKISLDKKTTLNDDFSTPYQVIFNASIKENPKLKVIYFEFKDIEKYNAGPYVLKPSSSVKITRTLKENTGILYSDTKKMVIISFESDSEKWKK